MPAPRRKLTTSSTSPPRREDRRYTRTFCTAPQKLLFNRGSRESPTTDYDKYAQPVPRSVRPHGISPSVHLAQVNPHPGEVPAGGIASPKRSGAKNLPPYGVAGSFRVARPGFPKPLSPEGVNGAEHDSDSST